MAKSNISKGLNIKGDNVLLVGNRGYKNLGDELILLGNIKLLLKKRKKITVVCFDPNWLRNFFSQFIDINQISFVPELPKGFRSLFKYIFKYGFRGFGKFWKADSLVLGGGEILTDENPGAFWYWRMSIRPFLRKKGRQKFWKTKKQSDLYIMGGAQIPNSSKKKYLLQTLLDKATACYLRDFDAVDEIKQLTSKCSFFMDTSYFAYDWNKVEAIEKEKGDKKYIVVNLNKNAEKFFDDLVEDIQDYSAKGYRIYYVPIAKGHNIYYQDWQYSQRLEKALGENVDFAMLDWETNFDYFVQMLKGAEKVFSSRLHLYLISSFMHCNTKVYPYQRKILKMQDVIEKVINN